MAEHYVAQTEDVAAGKTLPVTVAGHKVLVCHSADQFYVIRNQCSHAHARLTGGKLRGHRIFCPLHSAPFDLRDGTALGPPASEPICTYPTRVEAGKIFAELPAADAT